MLKLASRRKQLREARSVGGRVHTRCTTRTTESRRAAREIALAIAVVVALAGSAGVWVWWVAGGDAGCRGRSVDEAEYVRGNEAILSELQLYPEAELVNSFSIGQTASDSCNPLAENGPPYGSYATTWFYRLPPAASRSQVIDFFDAQVQGGWEPEIVRRGSLNCEVSYTRAGAVLYLNSLQQRRNAKDHSRPRRSRLTVSERGSQ